MLDQKRLQILDFENTVQNTEYVKNYLDQLLSHLQPPTFHCIPNFIVKILLHGPDGSGKRLLAKIAAEKLNMKFFEEPIPDLFDENIVGTEKKLRSAITKFKSSSPCLIYCTGYEFFTFLDRPDMDRIQEVIKESLGELESSPQPVIFIAGTREFSKLSPTAFMEIFQRDIQIKPAQKVEAMEIISAIKSSAHLESNPSDLIDMYPQSRYYLGILMHLCKRAEIDLYKQKHFPKTIDLSNKATRDEATKGTRWSDIGGLGNVKKEIISAIHLSSHFPQLKKSGLRRTGLLLYGPPGTGKTLLAKAVATECKLNFINIKGPEILSAYIGESEANIRKLFKKAHESKPSVIFFDEIDSIAPNRGGAGDSGGVMDRMVSQLLTEMDGLRKVDSVFVIGATNRVDLVDPSLLRPGRFDKIIEVPLPKTSENRIQILTALAQKMTLADDVNFVELESKLAPEMSGADFQGLCKRAMQKTLHRAIEQIEAGQVTEDDSELITKMDDFIQSIQS